MARVTNDFESGSAGTDVTTGNSGGGSSTAFNAVPKSTGNTLTYVDAEAGTGGGTPVSGTWVLHQVETVSELNSISGEITDILETTDVTGFCVRIPWDNIETSFGVYDFSVFDAARSLVNTVPGKRLSIRFMAGIHTPSFRRGRTITYDGSATNGQGAGQALPVEFNADGSRNTTWFNGFTAIYDAMVTWALDNDVNLIHFAWPGLLWSELQYIDQVIQTSGHTYAAVRDFHLDLLDHGMDLAGGDTYVEWATSGHVDNNQLRTDIQAGINAHPNEQFMFFQSNNVDDPLTGLPLGNDANPRRAAQMVGTANDYTWATIWQIVLGGASHANEFAEYIEVYTPSFTGGTSAALRTQITTTAPDLSPGGGSHGALRGRAVATTTGTAYAEWAAAMGTQTNVFGRIHLTMGSLPSTSIRPVRIQTAAATLAAAIQINNTGKFQLYDSTNTLQATSATTLLANTDYRFEFHVIASATSGTFEVKVFSGDSGIPLETVTKTGIPTGADLGRYHFGLVSGTGGPYTLYFDDVGVDTAGYLGPVAGGSAGAAVGVAVASGTAALSARAQNHLGGAASGTQISGANSADPDAFNAVNVGTGATNQYDNGHAHSGTLAMRVLTTGSAVSPYVEYTTKIGTQTLIYGRCYIYRTANPTAGLRIMRVGSGGNLAAALQITTAGLIQLYDSTNTVQATTSTAIALNQFTRIEWMVLAGTGTSGVVECKLFNTTESTTPSETETIGCNTGTSFDGYRVGITSGVANVTESWIDDIDWRTDGYPGPYLVAGDAQGPAIGAAVATGAGVVVVGGGGGGTPDFSALFMDTSFVRMATHLDSGSLASTINAGSGTERTKMAGYYDLFHDESGGQNPPSMGTGSGSPTLADKLTDLGADVSKYRNGSYIDQAFLTEAGLLENGGGSGGDAVPPNAGTWVIKEVQSVPTGAALTQINAALDMDGCVGFGARIPWNDIETSLGVYNDTYLNNLLAIATAKGKKFKPRFEAGIYTPTFRRGTTMTITSQGGSDVVPEPYDASGTANATFVAGWTALVQHLFTWARQKNAAAGEVVVPMIDTGLAPGRLYSELWFGPEMQDLHNDSANVNAGRFVAVNEALIDVALGSGCADGSDAVAAGFGLSGHGLLMQDYASLGGKCISERLAEKMRAVVGVDYSPRVFMQANGWGPSGREWGQDPSPEALLDAAVWPVKVNAGLQDIYGQTGPRTAAHWIAMFDQARNGTGMSPQPGAVYTEIYEPGFVVGTGLMNSANAAALAELENQMTLHLADYLGGVSYAQSIGTFWGGRYGGPNDYTVAQLSNLPSPARHTLANNITAGATTVSVQTVVGGVHNAPSASVPSRLTGASPAYVPNTWPYANSRGTGLNADATSSNTHDFVSWVRIGDEIMQIISAPSFNATTGVTTFTVRRGIWTTGAVGHTAGEKVYAPSYVGAATGADPADAVYAGNPVIDLTARALRYTIKIWQNGGADFIADRIEAVMGANFSGMNAIHYDVSGCNRYNFADAWQFDVEAWHDPSGDMLNDSRWGAAQRAKFQRHRSRGWVNDDGQAILFYQNGAGQNWTCWNSTGLYLDVDYGMAEKWGEPAINASDADVTSVFGAMANNRKVWFWMRWNRSPAWTNIPKGKRYSYGIYLLAYRTGNQSFLGGPFDQNPGLWASGAAVPPDNIYRWNLGTSLGVPTTISQTAVSPAGLYRRDYSNGVVVVNMTDTNLNYVLDATYWNITDRNDTSNLPTQVVGNITVPARDAVFLLSGSSGAETGLAGAVGVAVATGSALAVTGTRAPAVGVAVAAGTARKIVNAREALVGVAVTTGATAKIVEVTDVQTLVGVAVTGGTAVAPTPAFGQAVGVAVVAATPTASGAGGAGSPPGDLELPTVRHVITSPEGSDSPLVTGWRAEEVAPGGFWSANCRVDAVRVDRHPEVYVPGAVWTSWAGDECVWEGQLLDPVRSGQTVNLSGRGWGQTAERDGARLLFQSRDYSDWQPADSEPLDYPQDDEYTMDIGGSRITWVGRAGDEVQAGDMTSAVFWADGAEVTKVAGDMDWNGNGTTNNVLRVASAAYPASLAADGADIAISNGPFSRNLGADADVVALRVRRDSGGATFGNTFRLTIRDLRVNGLAAGDDMQTSAVVREVCERMGVDTWAIEASGDDILPLDHKDGSYGDLLDYCSLFTGTPWLFLSDGLRRFCRFAEPATYYTSRSDGDTDLIAVTRYNRVHVTYPSTSGKRRRATAEPSDIDEADPFAATGWTNALTVSIDRPQHNADLASNLAQRLLRQAIAERWTGALERDWVRDANGLRVPATVVRAGDRIVVIDGTTDGTVLVRVERKAMSDGPVRFDLSVDDLGSDRWLHRASARGSFTL